MPFSESDKFIRSYRIKLKKCKVYRGWFRLMQSHYMHAIWFHTYLVLHTLSLDMRTQVCVCQSLLPTHLPSSLTPDNSKERRFVHILCHAVLLEVFFQPPEPITLNQEPSMQTSQNHSINKSPRRYLSEVRDLRLPLRLVEFAWPFGATFVWLMCLQWIRSTQKPFKSQSAAFQSNAGRTMQWGGLRHYKYKADSYKAAIFQRRAHE